MTAPPSPRLRLTKHHGAGNDFLVTLDAEGTAPLVPELVAALCDRHRGVGADGVIRVFGGKDGADLAMELRNADGGPAEVSGNGLRCLAQTAVDAGLVTNSFTVWTAAGVRSVDYEPGPAGSASAWVDMGRPELGGHEDLAGVGPARHQVAEVEESRRVDVGNAHLVVIGPDPDTIDVAIVGRMLDESHPGGRNVEFVAVDADGALRLRVWERGAGETLACGTGSVAAAAVARAAGACGDRVRVRNPGGTLEVAFSGADARLGGPVHKVADIAVDPAALLAAAE